jgi:DNA-directed RNA polymerase specialized sigma24 family protein
MKTVKNFLFAVTYYSQVVFHRGRPFNFAFVMTGISLPSFLLHAVFYHPDYPCAPDGQALYHARIQQAFCSLGPLAQEMLLLKYAHDLSQTAIARRLQRPLSATRRTLLRSLHELRLAGNPLYAAAHTPAR